MRPTGAGESLPSPTLGSEHIDEYMLGLRIRGIGKVESKQSVMVQRTTYMKATLKWQGATHEFRNILPEIYQRVPAVGSYCRFELNLLPGVVRNQETGQDQVIHKPGLVSIVAETLATGSVPATSAAGQTARPAVSK